jgi:hypothetical protein
VSGPYEHGNSPRKEEPDMKQLAKITAAAAMLALASAASADLNRVGPTNPSNGFPLWYQDLSGQVLDICIPTANDSTDPTQLQEKACQLVRPPTPPYVFPSNFPGEVFYMRAISQLSPSGATKATLVLALEAAFGSGTPAAGQQMVFARIRLTAGVPFPGTYTVKHPYGTETFPDVIPGGGNRDIFFTEDVGLVPGNFTDALSSRVGPFLQHTDGLPGGAPAAPLVLPSDANAGFIQGVSRYFIGDGVTLRNITGSPYVNPANPVENMNFFEMCGPFDGQNKPERCIRENTFTLTGMIHDSVANPVGSALATTRATYSRDANGARVDAMARASKGPNQATPILTVASGNISPVLMDGPTLLGDWYARGITLPKGSIPSTLTVTNSGDAPPTSVTTHVTDEVYIRSASYDFDATAGSGTITVIATTSDKGDAAVNAPAATLSLPGYVAAPVSTGNTADAAEVKFVASGVLIPPAAVRVSSSAGGQSFYDLAINTGKAFTGGVPYAQDDGYGFVQDVAGTNAPVTLSVLLNDDGGPNAIDPASLAIVAPPSFGIASLDPTNAPGKIFYKVPATTGTATIKYTVRNAIGVSNVGTATVSVLPDPAGPIPTAVNDPTPNTGTTLTVVAGQAITVNVLANDSANGGALNPASVTVTAQPTIGGVLRGSAAVNLTTGAITYTSSATTGTATFKYTVSNTATAAGNVRTSNEATVTVNVIAAETLTMRTPGKCALPNKWQLQGTSTSSANNVVTIHDGATVQRLDGTLNPVIGTATVVGGAWQFQGTAYPCRATISIRSTLGTKVEGLAVQVK